MPGKAAIQVHVECSSTGSPGIDGDRDAWLWFSFQFPGEAMAMVPVKLVAKENQPGNNDANKKEADKTDGDDALDAAKGVKDGIDSRVGTSVSKEHAKRIKIETKTVKTVSTARKKGTQANPNLKSTTGTWMKLELDGVEKVDAASCHEKANISVSGNIVHLEGQNAPVTLEPLSVELREKIVEEGKCPPGIQEPRDPVSGQNVIPTKYFKRPWFLPPVPTPPGKWEPIDPKKPDGPWTGIISPTRPRANAMGVLRVDVGGDVGIAESVFVPWRVLDDSPSRQLHHILECLLSAGVNSVIVGARLFIVSQVATGLPVIGFSINVNYAGLPFPWHWDIGLWRTHARDGAPVQPEAEGGQVATTVHSIQAADVDFGPRIHPAQGFVAMAALPQRATAAEVVAGGVLFPGPGTQTRLVVAAPGVPQSTIPKLAPVRDAAGVPSLPVSAPLNAVQLTRTQSATQTSVGVPLDGSIVSTSRPRGE
jgi:hypothetical protein